MRSMEMLTLISQQKKVFRTYGGFSASWSLGRWEQNSSGSVSRWSKLKRMLMGPCCVRSELYTIVVPIMMSNENRFTRYVRPILTKRVDLPVFTQWYQTKSAFTRPSKGGVLFLNTKNMNCNVSTSLRHHSWQPKTCPAVNESQA